MRYILSRFNHDISWLKDYSEDWMMYDRSEIPIDDQRVIKVPNIGTDLYDKFTFIIENYDNLPEVSVYTKANLFKYITKEEFDRVKDNKTFTPLLTQSHGTYGDAKGTVCFYQYGMYYERNDLWFLNSHPVRDEIYIKEIMQLLGTWGMGFVPFAPGSNYILPRETILKHPKSLYERLRSYISWAVYPGEAQLIERGLFLLWQ